MHIKMLMETQLSIILNNQLKRIVNMDETCLELDCGQGKQGGHPVIVYIGKFLPEVGKTVSKSSMSMTMITGSTAAGEAILPHFQFLTIAQSEETMQLCAKAIEFMPNILGQFGCNDVREWPVTFGMNMKGGMDNEEYKVQEVCVGISCAIMILKMSQ